MNHASPNIISPSLSFPNKKSKLHSIPQQPVYRDSHMRTCLLAIDPAEFCSSTVPFYLPDILSPSLTTGARYPRSRPSTCRWKPHCSDKTSDFYFRRRISKYLLHFPQNSSETVAPYSPIFLFFFCMDVRIGLGFRRVGRPL